MKPAWSPNGETIAFESYSGIVNSDTLNSEIWLMDASGTNAHAVTDTPTASEWFPAWSPDSRHLAFMRQTHGGNHDIWTIDADGSNQRDLTSNTKHDAHPTWSPDGQRIAFDSDRADGGVDVAVTGTGWNFHEIGSDQTAADTVDIYAMNSDGSCATRLTFTGDGAFPAYWNRSSSPLY